jgi:hypothetical protein
MGELYKIEVIRDLQSRDWYLLLFWIKGGLYYSHLEGRNFEFEILWDSNYKICFEIQATKILDCWIGKIWLYFWSKIITDSDPQSSPNEVKNYVAK